MASVMCYYVGCGAREDWKVAWLTLIVLESIQEENVKISIFNFHLKIWSENHRTSMIALKLSSILQLEA